MIVRRNISISNLVRFMGLHFAWLSIWAFAVLKLYQYFSKDWVALPLAPMSLIGIAVAFYLGFKNNSAYDRMWEARKIWGAIVNSSRAWGSAVRGFVTNLDADEPMTEEQLHTQHTRLIHRHIAWLYQLREQLLRPTEWEHAAQNNHLGELGRYYQNSRGIGLFKEEVESYDRDVLLPSDELEPMRAAPNGATWLINTQTLHLRDLRASGHIDDFRHMELQKILYDFYVHQGKCERIKKFPLPRQYGSSSRILVGLFIIILPFCLITQFSPHGDMGLYIFVPVTALTSWVFLMMELVGDYSENPFQGMANDIPMLGLSRTIERDLRTMLNESDLPPGIQSKEGVLM